MPPCAVACPNEWKGCGQDLQLALVSNVLEHVGPEFLAALLPTCSRPRAHTAPGPGIMGPAANSFQGTLEGTLVSWGYVYEFFSKNALESAVFGG